jgi:hypothetical protein
MSSNNKTVADGPLNLLNIQHTHGWITLLQATIFQLLLAVGTHLTLSTVVFDRVVVRRVYSLNRWATSWAQYSRRSGRRGRCANNCVGTDSNTKKSLN